MRVACIGNMNNMLFTVTRLLRDRGVDCDLLIGESEIAHFSPAADSFDDAHAGFTRQLGWGAPETLPWRGAGPAAQDLRPYDRLIGCGTAPGFAHRAGRQLDLFIPYGSDLYDLPFPRRYRLLGNPRYQARMRVFAASQRAGIRAARAVQVHNAAPAAHLARLGYQGRLLRAMVPMVYPPLLAPARLARNREASGWHQVFARLRAGSDLVVFHHARHLWRTSPDRFSWKGNDRLLRGFALLCARRPQLRASLVTCEYGDDVDESRRLVAELGIEARVTWLPVLPRKEILLGLSLADVGTGEFSGGWYMAGTVMETLAAGKPLLHYWDPERCPATDDGPYPLLNAGGPEQICRALEGVADCPERHRALGEAGRRWLQEHAIERPLRAYLSLLGLEREPAAAPDRHDG